MGIEPDDWLDVTDLAAGGPITLQANVIGLHDQIRVITASGDACECGNADGNASVDFFDASYRWFDRSLRWIYRPGYFSVKASN